MEFTDTERMERKRSCNLGTVLMYISYFRALDHSFVTDLTGNETSCSGMFVLITENVQRIQKKLHD